MKTATLPKPTKRNSLKIAGQTWHFCRRRYWSSDTAGGSMSSCSVATRYSDGRSVTGGEKTSLAALIAERIEAGLYPEKLS